MALRWIAEAWRNQLDTFDSTLGNHRFYLDLRQLAYPHVAGTPTYTAITGVDNQSGDYNLTGSYAKYLLALTNEVTVHVRCKPTFAYDVVADQPLWSWYMDADRYLTLLYTAADDKLTLKWKDGGTERVLQSAAFANSAALQVWMDVCASVDVANGTGALYIDRASVDATWSGATDTKTSYFPTFELAAENGTVGDYNINHARVFLSLEATSAQISANFRDVENEEIYWPLDGHALGRTRVNVSRFVREYVHDKEVEKPENGAQSANRLSIEFYSTSGEFADDQYAAFDPTAEQFNGTSAQKYLQTRVPVIAETWYGNTFEPFFVGRVDEEMFTRQTTDAGFMSIVTISAEDFVADIANTTLQDPTYFEDKDISDSTESNSLVHLIGRLASQRRVYNYLANSSFENATIANSWAVSGAGATFTKQAGGLFGSNQGDLVYGAATATVAQTVTFTGTDKLSVGESYTFSIYLSSADNCGTSIYLVEADSGGDNDSSTVAWALTGGKGWKRFDVTHTITDSDSDRLIVRVTLDDNVTLSFDGAMLVAGGRAVDWFVLNNNDGASAVESADDADYAAYDQIGYDCDAVDIQHPWAVINANNPIWEHLKEIANGTAARYMGMDAAGVLRFRSPLVAGFADPTPVLTISTAGDVASEIDTETANKIIVHGVKIVKRTDVVEAWNAEAAGIAPVDYDDGVYWPSTTDYPGGYWAKYENADWKMVTKTTGNTFLGFGRNRHKHVKVRTVINDREQEVIGLKDPSLVVGAYRITGRVFGAIASTTDIFDTTTRLDAARILVHNATGNDGTLAMASIRGKLVVRYSGSQGYVNDKHEDSLSVLRDGENELEVANNFIVTQTQVDTLADYYWKHYGTPKHQYQIDIHGERLYLEPGEWYTVQIGGAGQTEYIDAVCQCMSVSVQRGAGDMGTTSVVFREVQQNWVFDSNKLARFLASGNSLSLPGSVVTVASSTYVGPADYYCDGTADQVEIQAAIDYVAGSYGGGTVRLTEGTFYISSAAPIEMSSRIALVGSGVGTIIEKSGDVNAIEIIGSSDSALEDATLSQFKVQRNVSDTNARYLIKAEYTTRLTISDVIAYDSYVDGIRILNSTFTSLVNCKAIDCNFNGIFFDSENALIYGAMVTQCGSGGTSYGIIVSGSNNTVINCILNDNLALPIYVAASYNMIQSNYIYNNPTSLGTYATGGIWIDSGVIGTSVANNYCIDNGNIITNGVCE